MATYAANNSNNAWIVPRYGDPSNTLIDGMGGIDRLGFDRLPRTRFLITQEESTGYIHVDSVSGASSTFHLRLVNVEFLHFNNDRDIVDLSALFKDIKAPSITSFNLQSNAGNVALDTNLVFDFSETVSRGNGVISLSTAAGVVVEKFDAATSSRLLISAKQLTIDPSANLQPATDYRLSFGTGSIQDSAGNALVAPPQYQFLTVGNAAPIVNGMAATIAEDNSLTSALPVATDKEGQAITYVLKAGPAHGQLQLQPNGTFVYTPTANFAGTDSFSFAASDGMTESSVASVQISISPVVDNIIGTTSNDSLVGFSDADIFVGKAGDDSIWGGDGVDTAIFTATRSQYQIDRTSAQLTVRDLQGAEGSDQLVSIERLQFQDQSLAFDLDGDAGTAAKILGAIGGVSAMQNKEYAGIALDLLAKGMSAEQLAEVAINAVLAGNVNATRVVELIFQNVVGTAPDGASLALYTGMLDRGELGIGQLGVLAANTDLNQQHIDIVGLAQSGLDYLPVL